MHKPWAVFVGKRWWIFFFNHFSYSWFKCENENIVETYWEHWRIQLVLQHLIHWKGVWITSGCWWLNVFLLLSIIGHRCSWKTWRAACKVQGQPVPAQPWSPPQAAIMTTACTLPPPSMRLGSSQEVVALAEGLIIVYQISFHWTEPHLSQHFQTWPF